MKYIKITAIVLLIGAVLFVMGCGKSENQQSSSPSANPIPNQAQGSTTEPSQGTTQEKASLPSGGKLSDLKNKVTQTETKAGAKGTNFFVGEWEIWIPGSFASNEKNNNDGTKSVSRSYVAGAAGKVLTINADYTYHWETPSGDISGSWEDNGDGRIVLLQGQLESDWYVEKTGDDEIKYYSWGVEEYGTRIK